ncbi:MAG: carboxypeptidase-like regulatory domain-containing protein [Bacteroidetes bacterium]|nr:carboxypeptidase-like regulatory domain-containing protein [Bacteroidota bacterium]
MKYILLIFLIFTSIVFKGQTFILSGKITDKKEPLPFATIMVKGTTFGTNSNVDGAYALKLPAGTYEMVYQYVGYSKKIQKIELTGDKTVNINLSADGVSLSEVEVKAGEDPAYPIIRKAIKKRKYYQKQIDAYTCIAYIKGLQRIKQIPKNFSKLVKLSGGNASDTADIKGVVYLSESESKYHYRAPDDEKEIMYSSKVSGDNKAFSFNQLSDMKVNFYNNLVELGNLSDRPFTSPINENAFLYYRFYLLGTIKGDGKIINKIKVVPKRKTDPCFRGIIYIQDSTWRITSVDLMLTKEAKIDFVDTLLIKQLHAPVAADSIWLPVTLNFYFDFKAFGFKGDGYFNANIKDYNLHPEFPKKFFKNEVLKVEEGANKKDTAYWATNRAVPLTNEEAKDYRTKDSIAMIRGTDRYKDSVDKKRNKFKFNDVFMGYTYNNTKKKFTASLPGIITNGVQYNTVEGLNLSYKLSIHKEYEDHRFINITGKSRYGFSNKLWGGELGASYLFKPEKFSSVGINIKTITEQFNEQDPISPLINSAYTLLMNENFMKLYKESALSAFYYTELVNGIYFNGILKYAERAPLKNTSDLLLIDDKNKLFTSNDPQNPANEANMFTLNNALTAEALFSFRFKQKYYTLPHQKIISGSKYPRLSIGYKKAFPYLNSVADYDLASINISDKIKLGLFGNLNYRLRGGYFLNTGKMYFMDYKHFTGNQTFFNTNDYLSSYRLLPYYTYSADKWFTEAHAEHHFNGFIINKIPLIKKLKVQEVVGGHFMASNKLDYYYEINFGLEKLFKVIRIDYVLGYAPDAKIKQGFTIGINMGF